MNKGVAFAAVIVGSCGQPVLAQQAQPNNPQETVERTIGSLVINNAQCNANISSAVVEIQRLKSENDDLKQKLAAATPVPAPTDK